MIADKYEVVGMLGKGGMGSVYEAVQHPIDRHVALKVLHRKSSQAAERFLREAKAASKLQHPNTITIHDFGETSNGLLYIAMEKLSGRPLTKLIAEGPVEQGRALRIFKQVLASVGDAHKHNVFHRDLKPDNVFLADIGDSKEFPKVLDFGLAKLSEVSTTLTADGSVFGTPRYMSPEQATGEASDGRSDIYSLGIMLFEMLMGKPPFDAELPVTLLFKHVQAPPPRFKDVRADIAVRPEIETIVLRCLAKKAENRFQSIPELLETLDKYVFKRPAPEAPKSGETPFKGAAPRQASVPKATPPRAASGSKLRDKPVEEKSAPTAPGVIVTPDGRVEVVHEAPKPAAPAPKVAKLTGPEVVPDVRLDVDPLRPRAKADRRPTGEVYTPAPKLDFLWKVAGVVFVLVAFEVLIGRHRVVEFLAKILG